MENNMSGIPIYNGRKCSDIAEHIMSGKRMRVLFTLVTNPVDGDINSVGYNTGNLVFTESIKKNVEFDLETSWSDVWSDFGKKNVFSIMAASNFINPTTTWIETLIPVLEKSDMHFTFAGLGAQGRLEDLPRDIVGALSERQKYFFKLVSERANIIGVRGEFTADCLEKMGIKNVDIIGCPSFYLQNDNCFLIKEPALERVLCTAAQNKHKIYSLAETVDSQIIKQVYSDGKKEDPIFFDFYKWESYIQRNNFTFAFGSRFHGNMMALRNGVPALWITHDWRTLELVRYLKLPYLEYAQLQKVKHVNELIELCDYSALYAAYPELLKKYKAFIKLNMGS